MANFIKNRFKYRLNEDIKDYREVRLVYKQHSNENSPNDFNKIVTLSEARKLSDEKSLDLIELNNKVNPPIIRLCDYSKFLWEQKKNDKDKNKNNINNI